MSSILDAIQVRINELKDSGKLSIFTIASTSKIETSAYLTPLRETKEFIVSGCVLFNQELLLEIITRVDGMVDIILVDQEKKVPLQIAKHENSLLYSNRTIKQIDTGNFFKICFNTIEKSKVYGFKPNDLTVNSIWNFLNIKMYFYSDIKITIIGAGNIGTKLALKLVECGAKVSLYGRDPYKGVVMTQGLNHIKSKSTLSNIEFTDDITKASFMSDVIIGATNGANIITSQVLSNVKKECLLIELGKNNFTSDAIELAQKNDLEIYRVDVTAALEGYIYELLQTIHILKNSYGKNVIDKLSFVSGGFYGTDGDIVVDNCYNPKKLYGIADGKGSLRANENESLKKKIETIIQGN